MTARKCTDAINALLDDEDAQDEVMGQAFAAVIQIWVFGRLVKISVPKIALTRAQLRAIRSYEVQSAKHEQKLYSFMSCPTVMPGMEHLPPELIRAQQLARIRHLQIEIRAFKENIRKIRRGELDS